MKNNSFAVYILAAILMLSIGMYIYTSSQSTIDDSLAQISTQEIEAFNSQFEIYGGRQTGSKMKALVNGLMANSKTYKDEKEKIPEVIAEVLDGEIKQAKVEDLDDIEEYEDSLAEIKNLFVDKHTYEVEFDYDSDGRLNKIKINY